MPEAETRSLVLTGVIQSDVNDVAGLRYQNPDGTLLHCLNSKLAQARLVFERPGHPPLELRTQRMALESVTDQMQHGIRILT